MIALLQVAYCLLYDWCATSGSAAASYTS